MRSLEVAVPAFILALPLFFCFIWPFVYPVPKPVGGSILNSGLPILSPGHIFGTDRSATTSCPGSCTAAGSRSR